MKTMLLALAVAGALIAGSATAHGQNRETTSRLEIYDTETGTRTVLKEYPYLVEAPNWTVDGKYLVYNRGGKMYRVEIAATQNDRQIPTGSVAGCNNDHVLSTDGKGLAISSSSAESSASRIYTLPIEGGEPRLVTPRGPSYLHGWSPDGETIAYCADRGGNYDVYVISVDGSGEEIRLTAAEGLDDGPEYSPDGNDIWFNSVRSGRMQVWKMRADGSHQTQMTLDETRNSWFPHISPDGRQVVYIAYDADEVAPGDHPGGKNVELRLMTASHHDAHSATGHLHNHAAHASATHCGKCGKGCDCGEKCGEDCCAKCGEECSSDKWSEPETVVELFGGQGTINVNSWSPCSRYFAFVSYEYGE